MRDLLSAKDLFGLGADTGASPTSKGATTGADRAAIGPTTQGAVATHRTSTADDGAVAAKLAGPRVAPVFLHGRQVGLGAVAESGARSGRHLALLNAFVVQRDAVAHRRLANGRLAPALELVLTIRVDNVAYIIAHLGAAYRRGAGSRTLDATGLAAFVLGLLLLVLVIGGDHRNRLGIRARRFFTVGQF